MARAGPEKKDGTSPRCSSVSLGFRRSSARVALSAAIPVIFATGFVGRKGPYVDGGLVNNAPISLAIRDHDAVDRVFIVTPAPPVIPPGQRLGRLSICTLIEIVINERLARDIDEAHRVNKRLARLKELLAAEEIRKRTGWRTLGIVEVRPKANTPGGFVSGFFSKRQRNENLSAGERAAERALEAARHAESERVGKHSSRVGSRFSEP